MIAFTNMKKVGKMVNENTLAFQDMGGGSNMLPKSERPKIIDMRCRLTTASQSDYFRQRTQHSGAYESINAFAQCK